MVCARFFAAPLGSALTMRGDSSGAPRPRWGSPGDNNWCQMSGGFWESASPPRGIWDCVGAWEQIPSNADFGIRGTFVSSSFGTDPPRQCCKDSSQGILTLRSSLLAPPGLAVFDEEFAMETFQKSPWKSQICPCSMRGQCQGPGKGVLNSSYLEPIPSPPEQLLRTFRNGFKSQQFQLFLVLRAGV